SSGIAILGIYLSFLSKGPDFGRSGNMMIKQKFIDWLRQSGNPDNIILAALLEQNIIVMPKSERGEKEVEVIK
ncbi:MAG: hypothetical protein V3U91_00785, partial [Candidatus Aminicenantaceae bacterium]